MIKHIAKLAIVICYLLMAANPVATMAADVLGKIPDTYGAAQVQSLTIKPSRR
jgi:hypothetical protein